MPELKPLFSVDVFPKTLILRRKEFQRKSLISFTFSDVTLFSVLWIFGLEEGVDGVEALGGEEAEHAGDEEGDEADEQEENGQRFKRKLIELEKLRKFVVEFSKEVKVVIPLDLHCIQDDR